MRVRRNAPNWVAPQRRSHACTEACSDCVAPERSSHPCTVAPKRRSYAFTEVCPDRGSTFTKVSCVYAGVLQQG